MSTRGTRHICKPNVQFIANMEPWAKRGGAHLHPEEHLYYSGLYRKAFHVPRHNVTEIVSVSSNIISTFSTGHVAVVDRRKSTYSGDIEPANVSHSAGRVLHGSGNLISICYVTRYRYTFASHTLGQSN